MNGMLFRSNSKVTTRQALLNSLVTLPCLTFSSMSSELFFMRRTKVVITLPQESHALCVEFLLNASLDTQKQSPALPPGWVRSYMNSAA